MRKIYFVIAWPCLFFAFQASAGNSSWLEKTRLAADQGSSKARFYLGLMYHSGDSVARDKAEAARLYRAAAEQGLALAQFTLGFMRYAGDGVAQDKAEAARLYRAAAEQGLAMAQLNLGNMYTYGDGVAYDPLEALNWLVLAHENHSARPAGSVLSNLSHSEKSGKPHAVTQETLEELKRLVKPDGEADWAAETALRPLAPGDFTNGIGMEFMLIPAGSFMMGAGDETRSRGDVRPRHGVTISKPFFLGKYEVTQKQWESVMGYNISTYKGPDDPAENVA
jgi:TPR repeat protein